MRYVSLWLPITGSVGCTPGWNPQPSRSFPLVGAHQPLECVACHPVGRPPGEVPAACASCHESSRPPDHYPGDCGDCHTPFGWDDIVVQHDFFPLTNSHALPCDACHGPGGYQGLDPACASCHADDRPPNHFGSQDCGSCHVPTVWGDADFDHSAFFPVPHHGIDRCEDCHLDPGDYTSFSCTDCHTHAKSTTDDKHREVGNYAYDSDRCLDCHPRGSGD